MRHRPGGARWSGTADADATHAVASDVGPDEEARGELINATTMDHGYRG
jgi:hypothetical protein